MRKQVLQPQRQASASAFGSDKNEPRPVPNPSRTQPNSQNHSTGKRIATLLRLSYYVAFGFASFSLGNRRLRQFEKAPEAVRSAFWQQLRQGLERERREADALEQAHGVRIATEHRLVEWDEGWQRRSRAVSKAQVAPEADWTPSRDDDPLIEIPARVYIEALTGEDVPANGQMCCPLPDHDDHQPSFRAYQGAAWRCFGCNRTGTIYDFAAILWDVEPRGRGFVEIHKRLRSIFGLVQAA